VHSVDAVEIVVADDSVIRRLGPLADEASRTGIANVARLMASWLDGTQTYDRRGECLLAVTNRDDIIAVGGLAQCPDVDGALRVRRFYVADAWRRRGIASSLATRLVEHALGHTDTVTCNAQASPAARGFWEATGFSPTAVPGITHTLTR
jgi:GNAT superfamily N-acetyltransferase